LNKFSKFWHELLNPHCADCLSEEIDRRELAKESKICDTCETLKQQLAIAHEDYKYLLAKMMEKPEVEIQQEPPQITRPKFIPWKTRQQMLEKEDRVKANAIKNAAIPTTELEKEIAK